MSEFPEKVEGEESGGQYAKQLFSDARVLGRGKVDDRKLSILKGPNYHPKDFRSIVIMKAYAEVFKDPAIVALYDSYMAHTISIGGVGRNQALKAESIAQGLAVQPDAAPEKPGIFDRLTNSAKNREYREYEERRELNLDGE